MASSLGELTERDPLRVIGVCAGASLEGTDYALCEIGTGPEGRPEVNLLGFHTQPYPDNVSQQLAELDEGHAVTPKDLCQLHHALGRLFALGAEQLIHRARQADVRPDLAGLRGYTLVHLSPRFGLGSPDTDIARRFGAALELGEPAVLAETLGAPVVANFQARDLAAGGQGGLLDSYVDYLLFSHPEKNRVLAHLGGHTRLTYLPAGGKPAATFSFDAGPGSLLLDHLVRLITMGKQVCDRRGEMALIGQVDAYILAETLSHPFFSLPPPKSASHDEFGLHYARRTYHWALSRSVRPSDILRTLTELVTLALVGAYRRFVEPKGRVDEIIVSGEGAINTVIVNKLQQELAGAVIQPLEYFGWPVKSKEAIVYALLARETVRGRSNNLPVCTGAMGPRVLGQITPG